MGFAPTFQAARIEKPLKTTVKTALVAAAITLLLGAGLWLFVSGLATRAAWAAPKADALWSWSLDSWSNTERGADGVMVRTIYEPLALARNVALILLVAAILLLAAVKAFALLNRDGGSEPNPDEVDGVGRLLAEEIRAVGELFQAHSRQNRVFFEALVKGQARLEDRPSHEQIRAVLQLLVAASKDMKRANDEIERKLSDARAQVDSLRDALEETRELSARDALTKAYSRRHFDESLAELVRKAQKYDKALSLIIADIDHFKAINDRFGHPVGDDVLRKFSELLIANTKGHDDVARYGGEEFAILLPETAIEAAANLAEQIRRKLERKEWLVKGGASTGAVTASFGVAELEGDENGDDLVRRADAKLYQSKSAGRNKVSQ